MSRASDPTIPTALVAFAQGDGLPLAQGPRLKGRAEWTGGRVCITDAAVAPRQLTPIHKHDTDAQIVIVAAGTLAFYVEGSPVVELGAGSFAYRPAGLYHALWNPGDEPAHAVEITSPGDRFQAYMLEISALTEAGEGDKERVVAAAARAGVTFTDEGMDDLCATYGLTPATVFWK
jgi:quercetin dioxygenase-like cupin family protein